MSQKSRGKRKHRWGLNGVACIDCATRCNWPGAKQPCVAPRKKSAPAPFIEGTHELRRAMAAVGDREPVYGLGLSGALGPGNRQAPRLHSGSRG